MRGTSYHQENLLQAETNQHILGEFNTVKQDIIKALEENNKQNLPSPRVEVSNNVSSAPNDVLLTPTQSLAALTREVQSLKVSQNTNRQCTSNIDKQKMSWYGSTFWEKPVWRLKYCCMCGSGFHHNKACKYKKQGHKDESTYAKHMGLVPGLDDKFYNEPGADFFLLYCTFLNFCTCKLFCFFHYFTCNNIL